MPRPEQIFWRNSERAEIRRKARARCIELGIPFHEGIYEALKLWLALQEKKSLEELRKEYNV